MPSQERWIFGHALHVESPQVGTFSRFTLYSELALTRTQQNWLLASVPAPNVTGGWSVSAVMLRYTIQGKIGAIDKVGLRDGDQLVHAFEPLNAGPITDWETMTLTLPSPRKFQFGLGVSIHATCESFEDINLFPPTEFRFASVGLGFVQ